MPDTQVGIGGALIDTEQHLPRIHRIRQTVQPVVLLLAPLQPPQRPLTGGLGVVIGRRIFHALVEGHGNIAAQIALDAHALLRPHENAVPVQMAGEGHALLADLPQSRQREHLEPAGIRQDGAVPAHEPVQPAHGAHHVVTGAQMQVVCIGQLDLRAQALLQIDGADAALDGRLCAHVHEHRRLHLAAVGAGKHTAPGLALFFDDIEHAILLSNLTP